jgi:hypothetical protein
MIDSSKSYNLVESFGQKFINKIGEWLPWFKDMFKKLDDFFQSKIHNQGVEAILFYSGYENIIMQ